MSENASENENSRKALSRRQFLRGVGAAGAGSALMTDLIAPEEARAEPAVLTRMPAGKTLKKGMQDISLHVNGQEMTMQVEPRTTLVNALRNHAEPPITGPKLVCDQAACGACTVLLNGQPVYGCMQLAVDTVGKKITTVEGLANGDTLSPLQQAFVEHDALMCGFCTPGFLISIHALLQRNTAPTIEDVKHACAGNICRCGTYPHIFEAALDAAKKRAGG